MVGGGFATPSFGGASGHGRGHPDLETHEPSRLAGRGSQHRGRRLGESRPGTLVAYAYCVTKAPRLVTVSKRAELAPGTVQTTRIACPHGSSAYSGGFDGNLKLTTDSSAAGRPDVEAGGRGPRMARALARRLGHGELHVTVYAYCRGAG